MVVVCTPNGMALFPTGPLSYCEFGDNRRRYLTVQGPRGRTNRVCWHMVRTTMSCLDGGEWKTHAVIACRNLFELKLKVPEESDQNASDLEVSKLRDS